MLEFPLSSPSQKSEAAMSPSQEPWLALFHAGDRVTLARCYREHYLTVRRALGGLLMEADQETVIHEVFSRLIARPEMRRSHKGGSFSAWLVKVARNQAIDYRRRLGHEARLSEDPQDVRSTESWEQAAHARLLVERFRRECLPAAWNGVFELRFLQQLSQHEAARQLALSRTTLAYRELRIRARLKRFLLEREEP